MGISIRRECQLCGNQAHSGGRHIVYDSTESFLHRKHPFGVLAGVAQVSWSDKDFPTRNFKPTSRGAAHEFTNLLPRRTVLPIFRKMPRGTESGIPPSLITTVKETRPMSGKFEFDSLKSS